MSDRVAACGRARTPNKTPNKTPNLIGEVQLDELRVLFAVDAQCCVVQQLELRLAHVPRRKNLPLRLEESIGVSDKRTASRR